jgi:hypothetical protein
MKFQVLIISIILIVCVAGSTSSQERYGPNIGRYQLVSGEYDVRTTAGTKAQKAEYATHRTMFLIDTYTGKVWLFLAENDMHEGRWGWIPAKGTLKGELSEGPK